MNFQELVKEVEDALKSKGKLSEKNRDLIRRLNRYEPECDTCEGAGEIECPECMGTGKVECEDCGSL